MNPADSHQHLLRNPAVLIAVFVIAACGLAFVATKAGVVVLEGAVQSSITIEPALAEQGSLQSMQGMQSIVSGSSHRFDGGSAVTH